MSKVNETLTPETNNNGLPSNKCDLSGVTHGQYVAVFWHNSWVRGIIHLENQFLIWLVDHGIYLRANERTVYVNLPAQDKKYPTKVFEASVHGVAPVEKIVNDSCMVVKYGNEVTTTWDLAAIDMAQKLLSEATSIYFVPIAMMSTKTNDVVIGDLYLRLKGRSVVNLIDELEKWPVFLTKYPEIYIDNLSKFYTNRRQHRASLIKPALDVDLPTMTLLTTLGDYTAICAQAPELVFSEPESEHSCEEGSTITFIENDYLSYRNAFKLTPAEVEKYSNFYITVSGREYNVLNVLMNKARDLYMCEKYKDIKSVGRATSRSSRLNRSSAFDYADFD